MRRILAFFVLTTLTAVSFGCAASDQQSGSAPKANATGTTTYSNTSVPQTTAAPPDSANGNSSSSGGAAPKTSPNKPGIKPPT